MSEDQNAADSQPVKTRELLDSLLRLRGVALEVEQELEPLLAELPPSLRLSGANLAHYFALRKRDLRAVQRQLSLLGLSSLGRAEPHVLATIDAIIGLIAEQVDGAELPDDLGRRGPTKEQANDLLAEHNEAAFGPPVAGRTTRLMVTLPTEAASEPGLVERLVASGMSVARINAAHDDAETWRAMVKNVREAAQQAGRPVKVALDLPGPKLRTGPLPPGAEALQARPLADGYGRVLYAVRVRFESSPSEEELVEVPRGDTVVVPVTGPLFDVVALDDQIVLRDARGKKRRLRVVAVRDGVCEAAVNETVFFAPGLPLEVRRGDEKIDAGEIGSIPPRPSVIDVRRGDRLDLQPGTELGGQALRAPDGSLLRPAHISVDLPELFTSVEPGHRVMLDDGSIEGVVEEVTPDGVSLHITRPDAATLEPEVGINLPDTILPVAGLTDDDRSILAETVDGLDLVAMSFVATADDVVQLHDELEAHRKSGRASRDIGVVLKIERKVAVDNLVPLLLEAMRRPPMALMIARGDLAMELGLEWLADLEVELVWFGAAAHVPVVMATQVLESYAQLGLPTRAEITDAAWAARAECIMLDKGDFVPDAMEFLSALLRRMEARVEKRTPMLLELSDALPRTPRI